ncbi:DUF6646 family protein [Flavobacterium sp.]|uniref:DUF6646 family protein n=1 Tax=Flavobacterium sp. TaxID=239 RepID=UPI00286E1741|nr:DUF6646 family protein [Flavobacterium sp.]
MKNFIVMVFMVATSMVSAQAYKGKGDVKGQVGATFQDGANGISISADFGIGENMSYGFVGSYLLSANSFAEFEDRVDVKARFNANLGNVFKLDEKIDIYPGLNLGLRNFGAHLGVRYFFTDGFGLYTEAGIPIASYENNTNGFKNYNNQFVINIGASFNL